MNVGPKSSQNDKTAVKQISQIGPALPSCCCPGERIKFNCPILTPSPPQLEPFSLFFPPRLGIWGPNCLSIWSTHRRLFGRRRSNFLPENKTAKICHGRKNKEEMLLLLFQKLEILSPPPRSSPTFFCLPAAKRGVSRWLFVRRSEKC